MKTLNIQISGSIVALVTPFYNDRVDLDALQELVAWHVEEGTDGIVIAGSTGESLLLNEQEHREALQIAIQTMKAAPRSIPIIKGCGGASTRQAVQSVLQAKECGADAVLLTAPFYIRPSQKGILTYFKTIVQEVDIPIILYNHPGRTGVTLEVNTLIQACSEIPNIIAIKDSSPDLLRVTELRSQLSQKVSLLCGDDVLNIGYLAQGGNGMISVTANLFPKLCKDFINSWNENKIADAFQIHKQLTQVHKAMYCEPNPVPVKYALYKMNKIKNELRSPLLPIEDASESAKKILNALRALEAL